MEVRMANNKYSELGLKVFNTRDRKWNPTGFRFEIAGNKYAYHFEYSKEGWQACVDKIKSILEYYRNDFLQLNHHNIKPLMNKHV